MARPVLELLATGLGVLYQDSGRRGWKKFGVPPGGALDDHAAHWANVLVGNAPGSVVLEILFHGARFRALERVEIALTGATVSGTPPRWRTQVLDRGDELVIRPPTSGVWTYLGIRGGFDAARWFGSASVFSRGGLGRPIVPGDTLCERGAASAPATANAATAGTGARWVDPTEQRDYRRPPGIRVWRGPQWESFDEATRRAFFSRGWSVSSRSDRTGFRLEGKSLAPAKAIASIPSEPVLPGSIQVPPDGQPIVTMRDGPTVGGYPKIGFVEPAMLSWIAQCRPGQEIRFEAVEEEGPK